MSKGIKKSSRGPTFGPHPRIECQKSWKGGEGFRCLIYGRYLIHCHVLLYGLILMVCLEYVAMKYQERPLVEVFCWPTDSFQVAPKRHALPCCLEEQLKKEEQRQRKRESHLRTRILSRMGWKLRRSPGQPSISISRWLKNPHWWKNRWFSRTPVILVLMRTSACLGVATSRSEKSDLQSAKTSW